MPIRNLFQFFLVLILVSTARGQMASGHPVLPVRPQTPQEILLLFSGDTTEERILLTLNNNRNASLTTNLIVFTASGRSVELSPIQMVPGESKLVELSPLLKAAGLDGQELGWLKLTYGGILMEMGAQLTIYPGDGLVGMDSPRSLAIDFKSTTRDASFWIPRSGHVKLALTNSSTSSISVRLNCDLLVEEIAIPAKTTHIRQITLPELGPFGGEGRASACEISSDGAIDALRPVGTVLANGYAAPIRFYDPKTATFPSLTAVGLRTDAATHIVIHNVSDEVVSFTPSLREATLTQPLERSMSIQWVLPHSTVELNINALLLELKANRVFLASLTLESKAPKGAFVGSVTQTDDDTLLVEDIPLKTSNPPAFARGSYPLRWDQDYTNLVFVTNTSDQVLRIGGEITSGDIAYVLTREDISPGATKVYDVDSIRSQGVPDVNGKKLPLTASYGKFHWIEMGNGKNAGLLGRASVSSVQNHRRSSFSCGSTCANNYYIDPYFDPDIPYVNLSVGQGEDHAISQYTSPTNGSPYTYPETYYPGILFSSDTNVMSVSQSGEQSTSLTLAAISPGSGLLSYYQYLLDYYYSPEDEQCEDEDDSTERYPPMSVTPTVSISTPTTSIVTSGAVDTSGNVRYYSLTANGIPAGGTYSWTVSGSGLTLSNANQATVNMVGTASGAPSVAVTYSLNGQTSQPASMSITVLKPDRIVVVDDADWILSTTACASGIAPHGRVLTYSIRYGTSVINSGILMKENVPVTVDSCGNTVQTGSAGFNSLTVEPQLGYEFNDYLLTCGVTTPAPAHSCSFSFTNQQFQQKNADGTYTTIGTVGAVTEDSAAGATVHGSAPGGDLTGTTFQ